MRLQFWNIFLMIFFAGLVLFTVGALASANKIFYSIPVRDLILMALAVFRLVRLFTYDHITQFLRDKFASGREGSLSYTLGQLLACPWCTGLWFSYIVIAFYFATIYSWPVILILSLGAAGSFMQVISNWVGWSAELKRQQVRAGREG